MKSAIRNVFGIDERSLALLRIGLATTLLIDLAIRAGSLSAHYTDQGVLPRHVHFELLPDPWSWSLHMLSGTVFYQGLLMLMAAAAAVAMGVGYRTRLMAIVSWVLLVSLHARNPLILNAGDMLLRMLLLWSVFLPLGARASIDRLRRAEVFSDGDAADYEPLRLSIATAGFLLQLVIVYVVTGIAKLFGPWPSGDAMQSIFAIDLYAKPLATHLLEYPGLLQRISQATPWFEITVPLVALLPIMTQRLRLVAIAVMVLFHIGIELTLHVGLFSLVSLVGWSAFLPPIFWDWCDRHVSLDRLRRWWEQRVPPSGVTPGVRLPYGRRIANGIAALLLLYVVVWNVRVLRVQQQDPDVMPLNLTPIAHALSLNQKWTMFSSPRPSDGWYILIGEYQDGSKVELLTGEAFNPMTIRKPDNAASLLPNHRWRKYLRILSLPENEPLRRHLAGPICRTWSADAADHPLTHLEIIYIEETAAEVADQPPTLRQRRFYRGVCPRPTDVDFTRRIDADM